MSAEVIRRIDTTPSKTQLKAFATKIDAAVSEQKFIFLTTTFGILSNPNPNSQDQRDLALDLLRIVDLKKFKPTILKGSYLEAVASLKKNWNENSDPYGEIHMLLEGGKIIAPFVKNVEAITQTWAQIASKFQEKDAQYIMNAVEEIKKLALTQPLKPEPQAEIPLGKPEKIRVRHGGRKQNPQQAQLIETVKKMREIGMGNKEITRELNGKASYATVAGIASNLIRNGEIKRMKPGLKKKTNQ